jgi:hypothetical protein
MIGGEREIPRARFATACSHLVYHRERNIPRFVQGGGYDAVDGLPTWVRWIIVFAIGLSPILTFWIAGVLCRFRRRKLWSRAPRGAADVVDRQASPRENEAVDQRADGAL